MSNKWFKENKDEFFKKYSDEVLIDEIEKFQNGGKMLSKTLNTFFEEQMYKCTYSGKADSSGIIIPYDAINDDYVNFMLAYANIKKTFFKANNSDISKIKHFIQNCRVGGIGRKVANFPPDEARKIYFRYNDIDGKRLNILDTSCGFGSRMSAVVLSGHNYFGFDPNKELNQKLKEYRQFLRDNEIMDDEQKCVLFCCGSEEYKKKLKGRMDISFTSPPYFNLEKYSDDECASTSNYNNYDLWLKEFVKPTIINTYRYLKHGGYAMINIKNLTNSGKQKLFDDWFNIFDKSGKFEFVEVFDMQQTAQRSFKNINSLKEPVMVFRKK